jgi:hypothetical protein
MASVLKVDTVTGVTTAGSIAVTGEGNSTTTNLQQGLAKTWYQYNHDTPVVNDSFNVASIADTGTGIHTVTRTNVMANDDYSCAGMTNSPMIVCFEDSSDEKTSAGITTAITKFKNFETDGTVVDCRYICTSTFGDLA